ncbi:MAG TPA: hypothetical protein VNA21_15135 [Steroidobacteraceae bacterium]|nr:hypothetical protein [Steroidobacteraceae bacterium]
MMKCRKISYSVAVLAAMVGTHALAVEPPNPKDLTQGKWDLIADKSKFCRPAPRKSTREIVDAGWGLISVHWTGVDADGKPVDAWYVLRYDGDKYPADITKPAEESITWKLVSPTRVEFKHWSKDNRMTEDLVRTVSADGQQMTQTRAYLGEAKECVDTQVFRRI